MLYTFKTRDKMVSVVMLSYLRAALEHETDEHIKENMVGPVNWSMRQYLESENRFGDNGYITAAVEGTTLVGIGGAEFSNQVFPKSVQFGIRLWIHPDHRNERIPSLIIGEQLKFAEGMKCVAWTSFNPDRESMIRMIAIRSKDKDPDIAKMWSGFKTLEEKVMLNNVLQSIAYKDFS